MKDTIFKFKLLYYNMAEAFQMWRKEIWQRDLDDYYCCPGLPQDECGCQGATLRDVLSPQEPVKPDPLAGTPCSLVSGDYRHWEE